jgi:N-acetylglucosamine kinase-like BadF-type ATPase
MSHLVLAVDGGNSKTHVVLVDASGTAVGYVRGPGSSPHRLGVEGCAALLDDFVAEVARQVGLNGSRDVAAQASVYLAGVDLPAETAVIRQALANQGWAPELVVDNDTFALLRAGTDDRNAVAVVCGAGINCVGVAADGRHARFLSLGRISGDWGGGFHLGEEALWWAARAADGRSEATVLEPMIVEHFGKRSLQEVIEDLHFGRLEPAALGTLAPGVLRAASRASDPAAVTIVHRQAEEVVILARTALRRLGLLQTPATIVLGGGVLASRDPLLLHKIAEGLAASAPLARWSVTEAAPIVGAALLGLERFGAGPDVEARLRESLGHDRLLGMTV